jgi:hypothetical protein
MYPYRAYFFLLFSLCYSIVHAIPGSKQIKYHYSTLDPPKEKYSGPPNFKDYHKMIEKIPPVAAIPHPFVAGGLSRVESHSPLARRARIKAGRKRPPTPVIVNGEEEWEVEEILDSRIDKNGVLQYRVKWRGFDVDHDWHNASGGEFEHCQNLVNEFHQAHPNKPSAEKIELHHPITRKTRPTHKSPSPKKTKTIRV